MEFVHTAPKGLLAIIGRTRDTIADIDAGAITFTCGAPTCLAG